MCNLSMENLHLESEKSIFFSPYINFNADTGVCEIAGESYLEDAFAFYQKLRDWIDAYTGQRLIVKFNLTYFNTSSSKGILGVVKAIKRQKEQGKEVFVTWYYPNDNYDLEMEGADFMRDTDLEFTLIPYNLE